MLHEGGKTGYHGVSGKDKRAGFAGKYECSILMALYPDAVKLERLGDIEHWFTKSLAEANKELGEEMVRLSLEALEKRIV